MNLNTIKYLTRLGLVALFGLCATDGICQVRGLRFMGPVLQNVAAALFFLLAATTIVLTWKDKDRRAMGRLRLWAGMVLALGVGLLVLLWVALLAGLPTFWVDVVIYTLAVVTAPVASCGVMFWPIFGWTLVLAVSWKLCREMDRGRRAAD